MKKSSIVFSMIMAFAFVLFGCIGGNSANINATDLRIYDLYYSNMHRCQLEAASNININEFSSSDQLRANFIVSNLNIADEDEIAIMASVECFDLATTPKEITVDINNGLAFARLYGGKYVCDISYNNNSSVSYSFSISKDSSSGTYSISYKKQELDCRATITFSKQLGSLSSHITTFDSNGTRIETRKQFYLLQNGHMAYRTNFSIGSDSGRGIYELSYFKEVFNFNAKLSSLQTWASGINLDNLTIEKFVAQTNNDNCGYVMKHVEGVSTDVTAFGDLVKW